MDTETRRLQVACFNLAKTTLWERAPVDIRVIQSHADDIYKEALCQFSLIEELGGTLELLVRAVDYLHQVHAIPPMRGDVRWFSESLRTVLEICFPNSNVSGEARLFLQDLRGGIDSAISESAPQK